MRARLFPLLSALALAACAGAAAAEQGQLVAGSAQYDGAATQAGQLSMVFLLSSDYQGSAPSTPWIAIEAAALRAVSYTTTRTEASFAETPVPIDTIPGPETADTPRTQEFVGAEIRLAAFQPSHEVHAFASEGLIDYEATTTGGALASQGPIGMSQGAFGEDLNGDATPNQGEFDSRTFTSLERAGPLVVHQADARRTDLVLRGDFVLELFGVTLEVETSQGRSTVASGVWHSPVQGAPEPTAETVHDVNSTFVRLFLDDAAMTLAVDGGTPRVEWAGADSTLQVDGPVTLTHAYGRIHKGDREFLTLEDDRVVLPSGNLLSIVPQADGLAVDVSESDLGPRGTIADVPAPMSAALVGTGAVLALAAAVGVGLLRRFLRRPQLAEVEAAIEQGQYRKAARLAGRILARSPGDENAVLARGIALTKAGEHERAVRELVHHLSHSPASDGSLHYVLGLAQVDLGRKEEGHAALREAVRLTPALQTEVASRLGKAFSLPSTITKETNGYA